MINYTKLLTFITLIAVFALFTSCDEEVTIKKIISEIESGDTSKILVVKEEPTGKTSPELLTVIKVNLSKLKNGMSTDQVLNILTIDKDFNGIVTSEGGKDGFTFYYELKDNHELTLTFDYSKNKFGQLLDYKLRKS